MFFKVRFRRSPEAVAICGAGVSQLVFNHLVKRS